MSHYFEKVAKSMYGADQADYLRRSGRAVSKTVRIIEKFKNCTK